MKNWIKQQLRISIKENQYVDYALDNIKKVGGFNNLPDIDKLALLGGSGDIQKLKNLNLSKIFKENGGTFGQFQIKVKIKDAKDQPIGHKFSLQSAGKEGYLISAMHVDDKNNPYTTVRFKEFTPNPDYKGGGSYDELPIYLANMYPLDYNDIDSEFVDYQNKVDLDQGELGNIF